MPLESLAELLDEGERARAARFLVERARTSFVVAHGLLRRWLAGAAGAPGSSLRFAATPGGKPFLVGRPDLRFSLAHTDGLVGAAIALERNVGLDLERADLSVPADDLLRTALAPAELAAVSVLPAPERAAAFYRLWARKEAFLKGLGEGFGRRSPADVRIGEATVVLAVAEAPIVEGFAFADWHVLDVTAPDGYSAALAWEGPDAPLIELFTDLPGPRWPM